MRDRTRPLTALLAALVIGLAVSASTAAAQTQQIGFTCGRVTAYTAATATADGSITIGTKTFVIRAGATPTPPPPIAVGAVLCVGELDASGALNPLTASTFGDTVCGAVVGSAPGTLTIRTNAVWTFPVRSGTTFTSTQLTGTQCFRYELNAQGNAEIVAHAGAPGASPPAGTGQLPSTSTDALTALPLALALIPLLSGGLAILLRARTTR